MAPWPLLYWLGYRAGFAAQQPDMWAIVTIRRRPNGSVSGSSYYWYDLNNAVAGRKIRTEEARLKLAGIEYALARISHRIHKPEAQAKVPNGFPSLALQACVQTGRQITRVCHLILAHIR